MGLRYKLVPCKACGSPPNDIDWTGALEISGATWQTTYVNCSNEDCHQEVSACHNTSAIGYVDVSDQVVDLWNIMNTTREVIEGGFNTLSSHETATRFKQLKSTSMEELAFTYNQEDKRWIN